MSSHPVASVLASLALLALTACAPAPTPAEAPAAPASSSAAPVASAPPATTQEAPAPHYRAIDLTSACPHEVHLYFGEQPGDGKGQSAAIATGATLPVPRASDGTMVVWVVDEQGSALASVHVTKWMRHVRINAACSKLDADSTP